MKKLRDLLFDATFGRDGMKRWAWGSLGLGVALLLLAGGVSSLTKTVTLDLRSDSFMPSDGQSISVNLDGWPGWPWFISDDRVGAATRSNLSLHENGGLLGPPHAPHAVIREEGAGAYSHWRGWLLFSTPDASDPRINGRLYSVSATARIIPQIVYCVAASAIVLVSGAMVLLFRLYRPIDRRALSSHLWSRRWDYLVAMGVPAVISLFVWLFVSPIWNGTDSAIWLLWQWELYPHFPLLYPALTALATSLFSTAAAVVSFVTALQHVVIVLAIGYLASAFRGRWRILIVSTLSCIGVGFTAYAGALMTEPWDLAFLCVIIGATVRLSREGMSLAVGLALFLGILGAVLTRHASIAYAVIPIVYVCIIMLFSRLWRRPSAWVPVASVLAVTLLAIVTAKGLTLAACDVLGKECTSIVGRAGVYRIFDAYRLVPSNERVAWLERMAAKAPDDSVARALQLMATTPGPWLGTRDAIATEPSLKGYEPDHLMNEGFWVFARTLDGYALEQWSCELLKILLGTGGNHCGTACRSCEYVGQSKALLGRSVHAISGIYQTEDMYRKALQGTGAEHVESALRYVKLADKPAANLMDALLPLAPERRGPLLGLAFVIAILAILAKQSVDFGALMASLWVGFGSYSIAVTFATVAIPRYLAPLDLLLWISNALAIVALAEWAALRRERRLAR